MGAIRPAPAQRGAQHSGPTLESVAKMLTITGAALAVAAVGNLLVYVLLIINRTRLLNSVLAGAALWLSRVADLAAVAAVIGCAVLLTRWLIARRAAVFGRARTTEPRPSWALWFGCLTPLVNLAWAPVYIIELARHQQRLTRLRKPILRWWVLWAISTAAAVFALILSRARDAQGIADSTEVTFVAYLLGAAAVWATAELVRAFESRSLRRPSHRWVMMADNPIGASAPIAGPKQSAESAPPAAALASQGRQPAA